MKVHTIDLGHGTAGTTAAYLLESGGDAALVESGPDATYPNLVAGLARHGLAPRDVRTVFLTHIHLDHAGAAWQLAKEGATVRVHPRGAPHLADPGKLLASATRIYGERMKELWGTLEPIAPERLRPTTDGEVIRVGGEEVLVVETPGHAIHHNAYVADGLAFTGDVGGVRIAGGPVLPPTPPPDIDLPVWRASLARLRELKPVALYPTHFDRFDDVEAHLDALERELSAWAGWVKARMDEGKAEPEIVPGFETWLAARLLSAGQTEAEVEAYRHALPFAMNVTGLVRYFRNAAKA
ncbi:MAG: MBL fold metallo-hydrolase [Holophagales bacterium]|jgi:glyoxylase-like metal-dependent hydrolase (beta-lactamase superfamily II)|nr:MBL fold metallo-hydrolase [Holophagales bacterium]MBK9965172.1 MBL fold metallo-hydrolase [Holophagales bacterium]